MEDLREGKFVSSDRDKTHQDDIHGSNLEETRDRVVHEDMLLQFLIEGTGAEDLYKEAKRARAIEYMCDRVAQAARGVAHHAWEKAGQERLEHFEKRKQQAFQD